MQTIMEILEKFENLIYKILVWIVLIPKTLLQVVLHPDFAPDYIKQELAPADKGGGNSRFDEYFSPVVLLLLVALLPFVVWNFLPIPGVEITSPAIENPTQVRSVDFEANIKFISTSTDGFVTTFWRVEKEFFDERGYHFPVVFQNRFTNNPLDNNQLEYFNYTQIDNHTIRDFYNVQFPEAGDYWVVVDAGKFDPAGNLIESYTRKINIYVPTEDSQANINIYARSKPDESKFSFDKVSEQLQSEKTIFLALGLLMPPLLFALAIKLFSKDSLSEDSLKETFYVQCYYFAPIVFVFWATRYAGLFFTPDVFFRYDTDLNLIVLLPLILAAFWFVAVQTRAVATEGKIGGGFALLIVLVCVFISLAGILFAVFNGDPDVQEVTRKFSIWLYPLLAAGLLSTYHFMRFLKSKREKLAISTGDKILVGGISFIIFTTMCLVLIVGGRQAPLASKDFDITQQSYVAQSADQLVSFDEQKFYTEKFDGDIDAWGPAFVINGDISQVTLSVENGSLNFQLSQVEGQNPYAYLINNAFLYTDVQVEAVIVNNTDSATTVSLVCRYNISGWYEFEVSNSGFYTIYAFDSQVNAYTELVAGESSAIKTGASENVYTVICAGDELTLIVNNVVVKIIQDTEFNFAEGLIGMSVGSPESLPVDVSFGRVITREPSDASDGAREESSEVSGAATPDVSSTEPPTEPPPTDLPLPEAQQFFTEEFDTSDNWSYFVVDGNNSRITDEDNPGMSIFTENSALTFDLDAKDLWTYFTYDPFEYEDARIDIRVTNRGVNTNDVSLICRYTDTGWYEFNIGNDGLYTILVTEVDSSGYVNYNEMYSGGSTAIKSGNGTNEYTAICNGNILSLYINGEETRVITETNYKLTSGKIGVSVSSFDILPVVIDVDWVMISEP